MSTQQAHLIPPAGLQKHIHLKKEFLKTQPQFGKNIPEEETYSGAEAIVLAPGEVPGPQRAAAPLNGNILFILAEFTDQLGIYSEASFAAFINSNIKDYFNRASYGLVTLSQANESFGTANNGVVGWVNLGYNHPDTGSNTDTRNQTLTKNAIIAADPYVDF
ncbi:MAG: hypothetical protein GTO60_04865, partial [Gammaproteobacteria bacterium]|nr:hypothetical protein [Gammaproteobacteria bacterium]